MVNNDTLFLLGGTGGLGAEIAKGLVTAKGFGQFKAIVRDVSKAKALQDGGWTVVEADGSNEESLTKALEGAKVVVSAYGGGSMVDLEKVAIQASKSVGASAFVPSQFGVDYRRWGAEFPFLAGKKVVLDFAKEQGMPVIEVFTGMFSDFIMGFLTDMENGSARIIGNPEESANVSFTRRSDIGKVLAKALEDTELVSKGGTLSMQGSTMKWKDAVLLLSKVMGKEFTLEEVSIEDANKQKGELLEKGMQGDMGAFYGSFALELLVKPAMNNTGGDTSAESKDYGVKLESLEETLTSLYGSK